MSDILDEQEFFDLMQNYRHSSPIKQAEVIASFEAVKQFIRDNKEAITNEFLTAIPTREGEIT